ncbi:MAG: hypothetical protein L0H24_10425, partial [Microlunatus sp.]|nr:hypothetical protein [Microlunatus sp.]
MISPAEQASPAMSRRYLWGLAAALAVTAIVALIEIDAQSDRVVDRLGRAWPFAVLAGPNRSERTAGWLEVITSGLIADPLYRALLSWYLVVDAIFIVAYAALLIGLVRAGFRSGNGRLGVTVVVCAAALTNVVENLVIMVLLVRRTGGAVLLGLLDASTTLKWLLIALAVVALIVRFVVPQRPPEPTDVRPAVRRTFTALLHHRFSVAMVVPLVVLTVLSGSAILEQLPDVQRRWASDGSTGRWQATAAVAAVLLVAFLLEVLARFRTGWAERHEGSDEIRTRIPAAPRRK